VIAGTVFVRTWRTNCGSRLIPLRRPSRNHSAPTGRRRWPRGTDSAVPPRPFVN